MRFRILFAMLTAWTSYAWCGQNIPASGLILKVDPSHRKVLVSCDRIPGYMEAMTMNLPVRGSGTLSGLTPGVMIDFTLAVGAKSSYAANIRIRAFQDLGQQALAARRLKLIEDLDRAQSSGTNKLGIGERVPSILLVDQNRKEIDVAGFPGKVVLMNFIYTHCPLPDYCFRLSNNLANVQRRFAAKMGRDLMLLSVTFDPVHDQPEVLADYARTWKADPNWRFLTGEVSAVRRVCKMFGVDSWPNEAELMHSLHTVMIDRQGRLAANLEGNQFTARQLGDLVESALGH
jgi:protein SCO1/2